MTAETTNPNNSSLLSTQAAGTLLALLFVYVIYQINKVLSDFRDPIFYSILCATSLRLVKDRIVRRLVGVAQNQDTIMLFQPFVLLFIKPVELVLGVWGELKRLAATYRNRLRAQDRTSHLDIVYALADTIRSIRKGSKSSTDDISNRKTSSTLLRVLSKLVLLQLALRWIKSTLSSASQVAIVSLAVTIGVGATTLSFLPYTSLGPLSPHKTRTPASKRKRGSVYEERENCGAIVGGDTDGEDTGDNEDDETGGKGGESPSFTEKLMAPILSLDAVIKRSIATGAHSLVSAVLILALVLGSAIAATFLGYQIISECRDVGLSLKDALSDLGSAGGQRSDDFLSEYRMQANEIIQQYLPTVFDFIEARSDYVLSANNLTAAAMEGRLLMEQIRGPRYCSRDEREKLLVALARATAQEDACAREEERLAELLSEKTFEFSTALRRFENRLDDFVDDMSDDGHPVDVISSPSLALIEAEDQLKKYHEEYSGTSSSLSKAQRATTVAERRLALCSLDDLHATSRSWGGDAVSGHHLQAFHDVGTVIRGGFGKIVFDWDVAGGISDTWNGLNSILHGLFRSESSETSRSSASAPAAGISYGYHIDSLQSVVQAATGPLVSVSRALFLSTSAALVGTSSLFRFGASLFQFGMQSLIFLSLLFALLSAEEDPLTSMIYRLPFPPEARDKAAIALNKSLGGVFVTLIKLCVIHGLFTWVTFTFFDAPLVYLTSTVSAAFSIVPFVPSWLVAIPSATALAVQGRIVSSIVLLGLHFAAYSFGDTEILNEAGTGGQPYLMSLSVFGGLYAVPANPVLGAMAGPVFFSLGQALMTLMGEL